MGPAAAELIRPPGEPPVALAVLTHGAGGGVGAADLRAVAGALAAHGLLVALLEQPYRVAGRRAPPAAGVLDAGFAEATRALAARWPLPLVTGGRSLGARVACRTAGPLGARVVVALAFPLHPPGRPDRSRAGELSASAAPVVVAQGERDPFGGPGELPPVAHLIPVPAATHSLAKLPDGLVEEVAGAVLALVGESVGRRAR